MDCKKLQTGRCISSTFTLLLYIDRCCFLELVLDTCSLPYCYSISLQQHYVAFPRTLPLCSLLNKLHIMLTLLISSALISDFFKIKRRILSLKNNVYLCFNFCYVVMTTFNYGDLCIIRVKELMSTAFPLLSHF